MVSYLHVDKSQTKEMIGDDTLEGEIPLCLLEANDKEKLSDLKGLGIVLNLNVLNLN